MYLSLLFMCFQSKKGLWAHREEQIKQALKFKIELVSSKMYKLAGVPIEDSDQTA